MYTYLTTSAEGTAADDIRNTEVALRGITCGQALGNWYYKSLMTNSAKQMITSANGEDKIPDAALQKMMARVTNSKRKSMADVMRKLDSASKSYDPDMISVTVEWHRGRYGELNPIATVSAGEHITSGRATGSGYDKESSAVAIAMNKNPAVLRVWYDNAERGNGFEYSVSCGVGELPYMDGGCGMDAVIRVFDALGYQCEHQHGVRFDYYVFKIKGRV